MNVASRRAFVSGVLGVLTTTGCGYQSVKNASSGSARLRVTLGERAVDAAIAGEVLLGARAALAREGVLSESASDATNVVIDVLRVDEGSAGIVARDGLPQARGAIVSLTGRARIDATSGFDTGDVTVESVLGAQADPRADLLRRDDALRDAARRLGDALMGRILGVPATGRNGSRGLTDMLPWRP